MNAPLILVNGWPGVGKDTVAETLQLMLGDDKASLVDWHGRAAQGSNSEACFEPAVPDDDAAAAQRRDACLAAQVEHPSAWPRTIICTDCLPDTPAGRRRARGFEAAARRCQRLLVPVYLECQVDENMRRIANAERRVSLKDKSECIPFHPSSWGHSHHFGLGGGGVGCVQEPRFVFRFLECHYMYILHV